MKKNELVTDLTNIVYRHTDALEKASKTQADTDKQLVDSMQQIRDLAADHDLKATQLADFEAATQVVVEMVEENNAVDQLLVSVSMDLGRLLQSICVMIHNIGQISHQFILFH